MKYSDEKEVLYHIGYSKEMIKHATVALLLDDAKYVKGIAEILDKKATFIAENREYITYLATFNGENIVVTSTGFGAPPLGIGVEEMAMVGIEKFIRIGEVGALQYSMHIGDMVIATASVRRDGTSRHYAPLNYPAAANMKLTESLEFAVKSTSTPYFMGITATTDTPWPVENITQSKFDYINNDYYRNLLDKWRKHNVLAVDNAVSALFTMCNAFNLEAAALMDVVMYNFGENTIKNISVDEKARMKRWQTILPAALTHYFEQ